MLDRAADAQRQIQLGRDRLPRRSNLTVHRQPAVVADRTRSRQFSAQRIGQLFREVNIFLFLDPAANRNDDLCLRQVHRLLGFLEHFLRFVADDAVGNLDAHGFDRRRRSPSFRLVSTKRPVLESHKPRSIAGEADIGGELALKHLPRKHQLSAFVPEPDAVADHRASHRRSQFGHEVTHLIGMRHQHQLRLFRSQELLQTCGKGVGSVRLQLRRLDRVNLRDSFRRDLAGKRANARAHNGGFQRPSRGCGDGLPRGYSFPGSAVEFPFALFDDDENCFSHWIPQCAVRYGRRSPLSYRASPRFAPQVLIAAKRRRT